MVAVAARPRKNLDQKKTAPVKVRFAVHLRALMAERKWEASDLHDRLTRSGMKVARATVHHWMRGHVMPKSADLEAIGLVFGLDDPRHILPPLRSK